MVVRTGRGRVAAARHNTSFALNGQLLRYQLVVPPPALPQLEVRETQGMVQDYTPPGPVA